MNWTPLLQILRYWIILWNRVYNLAFWQYAAPSICIYREKNVANFFTFSLFWFTWAMIKNGHCCHLFFNFYLLINYPASPIKQTCFGATPALELHELRCECVLNCLGENSGQQWWTVGVLSHLHSFPGWQRWLLSMLFKIIFLLWQKYSFPSRADTTLGTTECSVQ